MHIKSVHEKVKNYKCDICDKAFSRYGALKIHVNSVHEELKNHKCDLCDKAYSQLCQLKLHIKNVHENPGSLLIEESPSPWTEHPKNAIKI